MRADYDSSANAISIAITDAPSAEQSEPLIAAADHYHLDREALEAAAQSALAAPDRVVSVEVAARTPA